uniref:Putative Phospholipase A2 n=1 Tax=Megacormus gertschi TaxID=1843536 RepID=A0A224XEW7_9SCOR
MRPEIKVLAFALLLSVNEALEADNELYLNFEPLPDQLDGFPETRAVHMQFTKRSEDGRELRTFEGCRILTSINEIAAEALRTPTHAIRRISKEELESYEGRCQHMPDSERVVWGTKWCGAGNIAKNYEDLGIFDNVDRCCRDHDHCENIPSGGTKYGLMNEGKYTLMRCKCEDALKKCLDSIPGIGAAVGVAGFKLVYFHIYANGCYHVKGCPETRSLRMDKCVAEYTGASGMAKWLNGR